MSKLTLTYFDFQARGEPTRLALTLGGIPFEDNRISFEQFGKIKPDTNKVKFGQLPILDVDGRKFAQSNSILRYAGKIAGLYPQTYLEQLIVDEGIDLTEDLFVRIVKTVGIKDEEEKKKARKELVDVEFPKWIGYYNQKLQQSPSGYYFDKLSVADIYMYTVLRWIDSGLLDYAKYDLSQHKAVYDLYNRIDQLPKVKLWNSTHPVVKL